MENTTLAEEGMLKQASELVSALQEGDQSQAMQIVDEITRLREKDLFHEIGRMTRQLHDVLIGLHVDSNIINITVDEIPDARERLRCIVGMTENAAHRTMTIVEDILPLCEALDIRALELKMNCAEIVSKERGEADIKRVANDMVEFFAMHNDNTKRLSNGLRDILVAQEYQDLTGQAIKRVIELVQRIEDGLVEMIRASGSKVHTKIAERGDRDMESITSQDDVDELLSSMGF